MNNFQKFLLVLVILMIPISYIILNTLSKEEMIVIPPIVINPEIKAESHKENLDNPDTILSNLKMAVEENKDRILLSKEDEANEVLKTLKENINRPKERKESFNIIELPPQPKEVLEQNYEREQALIRMRMAQEKEEREHLLAKKQFEQKKRLEKQKLAQRKKAEEKKKLAHKKKMIKKEKFAKSKNKNDKKIVQKKEDSSLHKLHTNLNREEEVSFYKKQHDKELEVVGVTKAFEIKDPTASIPDEHYFKKHDPQINQPVELNQFVETLGVVDISKHYEVNVAIPPKVELAKDGIVEIPTATVETEELKQLKFVKPLEVTEVSEAFEASRAKEYLSK